MLKLSMIKTKRAGLAVATLAAFAAAAGASQAHHWPQGGNGPGRPGSQPADPAQLPFTFRYRAAASATGAALTSGAAYPTGSPVISGGLTLPDQRIATGHVTEDGLLIGAERNARIQVRSFATGVTMPAPLPGNTGASSNVGHDIDDENEPEPGSTGSTGGSDNDWWGPTRHVHPVIASDHNSAGQIYAVYNDDNQTNQFDPNPGENDIAIAQVDAASGALKGDYAIGDILPENIFGGTDGYTIQAPPVISQDLGGGSRKVAFVMTGPDKSIMQLTIPNATTNADNVVPDAFDQSPPIPDLNTQIPPTYVYMREPDSGSRVLMVAVATSDGVKTFRSSNLSDAGPSIGGIGPTTAISVPQRSDGTPATSIACPPRPACSAPLYVASQTAGEGTVVHKLMQDESNINDPGKLATLIPVNGRATSAELPGKPARGLAVEQVIPTAGPEAGIPQPGRVVVSTSVNIFTLDAQDLAAPNPASVFPADQATGYDKTIPSVSGGLGFASNNKGQQVVFYTDPNNPAAAEGLRVPPDETGFQPNEQALNSTVAIAQPAISRGRVVFAADNGLFTYGPTVVITRPSSFQSVFGTAVPFEAYVQDPALTSVTFFVDGQPVGTDAVNDDRLFAYTWDATSLPDGPHTVRAEATDGLTVERSAPRTFIVNNFRDPTAALTVNPTRVNPGQPVTLDASASRPTLHEDESIAQWAFDLDGDGEFDDRVETAANGGDGIITHTFGPGEHVVGVRVTDTNGDEAQVKRTVRVNAPPAANLAVGPNPAAEGQEVTLDASTSTDSDGSVTRYEFDLDGNGTFELDNGANPKVQRVFAPGTLKIAARVTDNEGASSIVEATLVVNANPVNQLPVATFKATPNPVKKDTRVLFDATGARDPDGRIVKYEWDLDGNGTYETNSQNNPRVQRSYAVPKVYNVKLRVTDNVGALSVDFTAPVTVTGTLPRKSPRRLTAKVTPMRDRALPYDFRTTGKLVRPSGITRKAGCTGRVTIVVKAGKKTISRRTTRLRRNCTYRSSVRFRDRSRIGSGSGLRFTARFQGNKLLRARQATSVRVRVPA